MMCYEFSISVVNASISLILDSLESCGKQLGLHPDSSESVEYFIIDH